MKILAADTALGACSVAVLAGREVLAHRFVPMDRGHAEALAPMVEEAMREAGIGFAGLDRLAVTTGPGTFTGQRVGLAFMRGLRVGLKKPLVGIATLAAMAQQAMAETGLDRAAAIHDARRDEFYVEIVPGTPPAILNCDTMLKLLDGSGEPLALAGTGAPYVCDLLKDKAVLSYVRQPDALWVAKLAAQAPAPVGPPHPLYLRAPDAKLPASA